MEILARPQLSIFAWRVCPPIATLRGSDDPRVASAAEAGDGAIAVEAANRAILQRINKAGNLFLSDTTLDGGTYCIRVAVLGLRTTQEILDRGIADIKAAIAEVCGGVDGGGP